MILFEPEIEGRVCEILDTLTRPAGEFTPRVRIILTEFAQEVQRLLREFEDAPTLPRIRMLPPPVPHTPRNVRR